MEEKQTMDEKTYQTALGSIIERVSRLENEVRELRHILLVQMSCDEQPIIRPSSSLAAPNLPELVVPKIDCWEVTCLGNFRLRCTGRDVDPCKSQRGQSILKYLLASPGYAASAEALMECFWPQADPVASKRNLQAAVHALRNS